MRGAGLAASHLDSHHHVHTEPGIAGVVIALAREQGVQRVRLARNCGTGIGPANRAEELAELPLRRAGLAGTRWFGSLDDYLRLCAAGVDAASFELMTHPVLALTAGLKTRRRRGSRWQRAWHRCPRADTCCRRDLWSRT